MKFKGIAGGLGTTILILAATDVQAEDGYDAPAEWPSPVVEHSRGSLLFDRLEYARPDEGDDALVWDFRAWYGGDVNRIYLKGEGENVQGDDLDPEFESLDLLYSRLIAPFWELQGGVGYQGGIATDDHPERYFGVLNLQGVAPYRFETDADLRISEDGDISASLESEYDLRISQRLFLQPRLEMAVSANEVPEFGVGKGLNSVRTGLRIRYELHRKFAPYIGGYWQKSYGDTADMARAEGEATEDTGIVAGIRMWY
ncbi:copper resistance protein B [Halomonas sp.]|uniref:copper resistance protein B n=1 Tax=Halomonas sp. TaxID=1486246 RepID=UPI0025879741|nr:copper resistance protein B [Halomonas sp.]MCJ8286368.1 copper resistance protein B [Halomonas sp.]